LVRSAGAIGKMSGSDLRKIGDTMYFVPQSNAGPGGAGRALVIIQTRDAE
jgi:hypothetical protein